MLSLPTLGLLACLWKPTVITSRGWCVRELCNLFAIARSYACTLLPEKYYAAVWRWFIHCSNFQLSFVISITKLTWRTIHTRYDSLHNVSSTWSDRRDTKTRYVSFWITKSSGLHLIAILQTHRQPPPPPPHTHKARASRGSASEVNEGIIFRMCILVAIHKAM